MSLKPVSPVAMSSSPFSPYPLDKRVTMPLAAKRHRRSGSPGDGMIAGVEEAAITLLRLIADDAPAAELAEAADRVAAEDPAARDLALRIRSGMDASKRREAEL